MTRRELIALLVGDFGAQFADRVASDVLRADAVEQLYALVAEPCGGLPADVRHKLAFRGAYVLERICFGDRDRFEPFVDRFCRVDFHACTDSGVISARSWPTSSPGSRPRPKCGPP